MKPGVVDVISRPASGIMVSCIHYSVNSVQKGKMAKKETDGIDPAVAIFFKEIVAVAFGNIKRDYLKNPTLSKVRIYPSSAEILIFYDPKRYYNWFVYRVWVEEEAVWRRIFRKYEMNELSANDTALVLHDYSITSVDHIISDFISQYSDAWATKQLG